MLRKLILIDSSELTPMVFAYEEIAIVNVTSASYAARRRKSCHSGFEFWAQRWETCRLSSVAQFTPEI